MVTGQVNYTGSENVHEKPGHAEQSHAEKDQRQVWVHRWIYRAHVSTHIFDSRKVARNALIDEQ